MVSGFRRSLSFSISVSKSHRPPEKPSHIRSSSLPSRSHPLISLIKSHILSLHPFQTRPQIQHTTLAWVSSGLRRIQSLHSTLHHHLQLPQFQSAIRHHPAFAHRVLEDYLLFADVYDDFRSAVIAVKHHAALAEVALRRRHDSGMNSVLRDQKKVERKIAKLAATLRDAARPVEKEEEVQGVIGEAVAATMTATAALFLAVSAVLTEVFAAVAMKPTSVWAVLRGAGKNLMVVGEDEKLGRLEEVEGRVDGLEEESERIFKCFMNIRVTLLNTLSPFS